MNDREPRGFGLGGGAAEVTADPDAMPPSPAATLHGERDRRSAQVAVLRRQLEAMVASAENSNADDEHDPEGATLAFERSQLMTQLDRARARVAEVEAALARLDAGTYGRCESCGRPIAPQRLEARPAATTCIVCARG